MKIIEAKMIEAIESLNKLTLVQIQDNNAKDDQVYCPFKNEVLLDLLSQIRHIEQTIKRIYR